MSFAVKGLLSESPQNVIPTVGGLPALLFLCPIEPCRTGNGLAMRAAAFVDAVSLTHDVRVVVIPVAGILGNCGNTVEANVAVLPLADALSFREGFMRMIADARWRDLFSLAGPLPALVMKAAPSLAGDVVANAAVPMGTPIHVMRSYLAPLGLAVAEELNAPWATLDLDDDDEEFFASRDTEVAAQFGRLVGAFGPKYSAVCLASPIGASEVSIRHEFVADLVSNGVPTASFAAVTKRQHTGSILFVGNLTYEPNIEAAVCLAREVFPLLVQRVHRPLTLHLVGGYEPNGPIADLRSLPGVEITGFVDDVAPLYVDAEVVIAPLRQGSGTRIKLLEAFAYGVPVVTTPLGASGLGVQSGEHLLLGNAVTELASLAAEILESDEVSSRLSRAAREFVVTNHSTQAIAAQIAQMFNKATAVGRPPL